MHRETLRHSVMGKNKSTTGWSYFYQTSVHTEKIIIKIKKRFGVFSCPKVLCLDQSLDTAGSSIPFGPLILRELIILMAPIPFHPTSWSFRAEAGKGHGAEQDQRRCGSPQKCFPCNPIILGHSVVLQLHSATGLASSGPTMEAKDRTKSVMDGEGEPSKVTSHLAVLSNLWLKRLQMLNHSDEVGIVKNTALGSDSDSQIRSHKGRRESWNGEDRQLVGHLTG